MKRYIVRTFVEADDTVDAVEATGAIWVNREAVREMTALGAIDVREAGTHPHFVQVSTASDSVGGVRVFAIDNDGDVWEYVDGDWHQLGMTRVDKQA